jgi:very-short-patch-repair endonuclease
MEAKIELARELRRSQTGAERKLWGYLRNRQVMKFKFRRQVPVDRFIVDFACLDAKVIIEVDGATHSTPDEILRDAQRTRVLESLGYLVIRFHNADVFDNIEGVLEVIARTLLLRGGAPSP